MQLHKGANKTSPKKKVKDGLVGKSKLSFYTYGVGRAVVFLFRHLFSDWQPEHSAGCLSSRRETTSRASYPTASRLIMAAIPIAVIQVQPLEAEDTQALLDQQPVLLDPSDSAVVAFHKMTEGLARWQTMPNDGRYRLPSLHVFLSLLSAAGFARQPELRSTRLDERSLNVESVMARLANLIDTKALVVVKYESLRAWDDALDRATALRANDGIMSLNLQSTVVAQPYQVFVAAVDDTPEVLADDLGTATYNTFTTYGDVVDKTGRLRGLRVYCRLFGAVTLRISRLSPRGQYRQMSVCVPTALSSAIGSLPQSGIVRPDDAVAMPTMIEWLLDHSWPHYLDHSHADDTMPTVLTDLNELVTFFTKPSEAGQITAKRFKHLHDGLPNLSDPKWLGSVGDSHEAYSIYVSLVEQIKPTAKPEARATLLHVEEYLAKVKEVWSDSVHDHLSVRQRAELIIKHHEHHRSVLRDTNGAGASRTQDSDDTVQSAANPITGNSSGGYTRLDMPRVLRCLLSKPFIDHANRVMAASRGEHVDSTGVTTQVSADFIPMLVWKAAIGAHHKADGSLDTDSRHMLIIQNAMYPKLSSEAHEVFGVLKKYSEYFGLYLSQYTLHGPGLGIGEKTKLLRFKLAKEVLKQVREEDGFATIDFLNDVHGPVMLARNASLPEAKSKVNPYAVRSNLDELAATLRPFLEALGIAPAVPNSTSAVLEKLKDLITSTEYIPGTVRRDTDEQLHGLFEGALGRLSHVLVTGWKSHDPHEQIISTLVPPGSELFALEAKDLTERNLHLRFVHEASPCILQASGALQGMISYPSLITPRLLQ